MGEGTGPIMGKKKSRARVQVVWVSRSHAVLKLHKKVLARLVASYHDREGNWEADAPIPLGAIESIMENPKLANGARFFWDHPRRRGMATPGLTPPPDIEYLPHKWAGQLNVDGVKTMLCTRCGETRTDGYAGGLCPARKPYLNGRG